MKRFIPQLSLLTLCATLLFGGLSPAHAQTAGLWRVDSTPDGTTYAPADGAAEDKIPLIVVHGLNNTIQTEEIKSLTDRLANEAATLPYYRVFTFEYDSRASIGTSGKQLAEEIVRVAGQRRFVLIGHSMGGLVSRAALELYGKDAEGHDLMDRCFRLITLGTPHHGTPAANGLWVGQVEQRYPFLQGAREQVAQATGLDFASEGVRQLAWDDFDGLTPAGATDDISGFLSRLNAQFPNHSAATSRRYVFYAGYSTRWPTFMSLLQLDRENKADQYRIMGALLGMVFREDSEAYVGNDGVVPISSALLLTAVESGSPHDPVARTINLDRAENDGFYLIEANAAAVQSRLPALRAAELFPDVLHHLLPVTTEVTEKIRAELGLEELATGDLSGEGAVDVADAIRTLRIIVGLETATLDDILAGDRDRNGRLTVEEAVWILKRSVGME